MWSAATESLTSSITFVHKTHASTYSQPHNTYLVRRNSHISAALADPPHGFNRSSGWLLAACSTLPPQLPLPTQSFHSPAFALHAASECKARRGSLTAKLGSREVSSVAAAALSLRRLNPEPPVARAPARGPRRRAACAVRRAHRRAQPIPHPPPLRTAHHRRCRGATRDTMTASAVFVLMPRGR